MLTNNINQHIIEAYQQNGSEVRKDESKKYEGRNCKSNQNRHCRGEGDRRKSNMQDAKILDFRWRTSVGRTLYRRECEENYLEVSC